MALAPDLLRVLQLFGGTHRYKPVGFTDELSFSLYGDPAELTVKNGASLGVGFDAELRIALTLPAVTAFGLRITARAERRKTFWSSNRRQRLDCQLGDAHLDAGYRCKTTDIAVATRVLADPGLRQWLAYVCAPDVNIEYHAKAAPEGGLALVVEPYGRGSPPPEYLCQTLGQVARSLRAAGVVGAYFAAGPGPAPTGSR